MTFADRTFDGIYGGIDSPLQERATIRYDYAFNDIISQSNISIRTLDNIGPRSLVKIYCACGKIVDLDRKKMNIKKSLKKDLECSACRNIRIEKDIDLLNAHFEGDILAEDDSIY